MRPATHADLDLVFDTYMDETVNPFMHYGPMNKDTFQTAFDELMARDYFWIIANDNGEGCGMITAVKFDGRCEHIGQIQTFGIKQNYQGQGLGKKALTNMIEQLKRDGITRIQLGVEADNESGIAFYKKLGFTEEGRQPMYLKRENGDYIDEILMGMII